MPKRYRIGDVAKLIGITPEAIRYYESKGLISPVRDEASGYRYYGTWDIHMLKRARVFKQFGFSLEDTEKMMSQPNDADVAALMQGQEQVLEQQIAHSMALLRRLRQSEREILDADASKGQYRLEMRPAVYRLHMQTRYKIDVCNEVQQLMQSWMNNAPFVLSSALFNLDDYYAGREDFSFGLVMNDEYADYLGVEENEYVQHFESVKCLYTSMPSRDTNNLKPASLAPAMEYIKQHGMQPAGDILTRVVLMRRPDDEYFNCHQIWIPVR